MAALVALIPGAVGAFATTALGATLFNIAGSFVLSALSRALQGKPKNNGLLTRGVQEMVRQPVTARRTIYGRDLVSGPLLYFQTYGEIDGLPNIFLSMMVGLAGHEVDAIEKVYFNDREAEFLADGFTIGSPFSKRAKANPGGADTILNANGIDFAEVHRHLGASNQAADSRLVGAAGGKWTTAHRLRGIAYVHARLRFDRLNTLFHGGAPEVRALVKGKKLFDTRTSTTAWSDNPALVVYDYLNAVLGVAAADIDTASFNAAANVCDELVSVAAGGTEKRYTLNGSVESDDRPVDVLLDMLGAMAGTLVWTGGAFKLYAGAAAASSLALDEDDLVGGITVQPRTERRELFNAVKSIYVNAAKDYQPATTQPITSATYVTQDGGATIEQVIELPMTVSRRRALRLAKIELERARQMIVVEATFKSKALQLATWDTCTLTNARFGWTNKKFRVAAWALNEDLSVAMTLREEADSMWGFDPSEEIGDDDAPDTSLPDPFTVPAPGAVTVSEILEVTASGAFVTRLTITIDPVPDGFRVGYEAQIKKTATASFSNLGLGEANVFEYPGAVDGVSYDIRVRTQNAIGQFSDWTQVTYVVAGTTTPPADVTGFAVNIRGAEALLTWEPVADVDLSHYRVRWASALIAATWAGAIDLVGRVARPATSVAVPALVGTYLIKAVDLKGNESVNATAIVTTIASVAGLNVVATITENPGFTGTHSGTAAVDNALKLDGSTLWDSIAGNWDDVAGLWDGIGGVQATGTYTFAGSLDLGAVYTSRLTAALTVTADGYASLWDDITGNWDTIEAQWDSVGGDLIAAVNVRVEVRTTLDDPGGSPTWTAWAALIVGDYRARAFQFRVILTSSNTQATPLVSALSVTVDMPDRAVEEHNVVSGAGAKVITFPGGGFRVVPALGVSAQGLATGDFYELTAKSVTGFTITFKNSGGSAVSRTFDYIARGYGVAA